MDPITHRASPSVAKDRELVFGIKSFKTQNEGMGKPETGQMTESYLLHPLISIKLGWQDLLEVFPITPLAAWPQPRLAV